MGNYTKHNLKSNIFVMIMLIIIVSGYTFFLISPKLFKESEDNLTFTELSTPIKISTEKTVSVEDWQYSKEENAMGIVLSFDTQSVNDASEEYVYQLVNRDESKNQKLVDYEVTYQSSTFATIFVKNVPSDFYEMGLRVGYIDKNEESKSDENIQAKFITVFTNKYKVNRIDSIESYSVIELYVSKINKENELLSKEIRDSLDEIKTLKDKQKDILLRVKELRGSEVYLSEQEAKNVETQISSYQAAYDQYGKTIIENNENIKSNQQIIEKNKKKLEEINKITQEAH